ncbi:hypothetical protein [Rhodohalobacter sp. 614A]|uniref:hypothetical protein n=1 Tax=Rhodohalobacter sp. 614A TaxID=2908649 RepID=UPI001F440002|nr:hypothetical protein [Rhodohalobacter sp. 614A]
MKAIIVLCLIVLFPVGNAFSQEQDSKRISTNDRQPIKVFLAYELGEMAFNNFRNFSGEAGVLFQNDNLIRFVYQNVKLSEKHLSSNFAKSVTGENIRGLMKSYEVFYDFNVFGIKSTSKFYLGLSTGYADDYYEHTTSDESVKNTTWTIGLAPSYRETNLFKVNGLYFNLAIPFRYYFSPLEETELGDSIVNRHLITNNLWFFIGYQF